MSVARILVVDDEADIRGTLKEVLTDEGYAVELAANAAHARTAKLANEPDLVLLDIWMPDTDGITLLREWTSSGGPSCPVVMMSGHGSVETAVEATRLGAFDFVEKPLSLAKLLRVLERALASGRSARGAARSSDSSMLAPVGRSRVMHDLREKIQLVSSQNVPVLFVGEVGTGREAFARYLHSVSPRASKPFVLISGGALGEADMLERLHGVGASEDEQPGLYEQAAGGTIFLSRLEDFSPTSQKIILEDIEAGHYTRLGNKEVLKLDVRFVSSVHASIDRDASAGQVRKDLLARLNVITLNVPSLREYAEDVPELLRYYVDRLVEEQGLRFRKFGVAAQNRLRNYPWPGNIQELKNLVHRSLLLGGSEEIGLSDIESGLSSPIGRAEPLVKQDLLALPLREAREAFERAYLQQQLMLCNGKVGQLAKRVGIERTHLYRKLRALGIDFRHSADE
jgi:DNA-binding NtrC family response regulator